MCERESLSLFLQLDEKLVTLALNRLKDHGIFECDEIKRSIFEKQYGDKLRLVKNKSGPITPLPHSTNPVVLERRGMREKVQIFFFNIDIMYVLKARLHILEKQLTEKLTHKNSKGNFYSCPTPNCTFQEIDEITYEMQRDCNVCGALLFHNQESQIDPRVE